MPDRDLPRGLQLSWFTNAKHFSSQFFTTEHYGVSLIDRVSHVRAYSSPSTVLLPANLGPDCQWRDLTTLESRMADDIVQWCCRYETCFR